MLKEALFWEKAMGNAVYCQLCMKKCLIDEGQLGWCESRMNKNGKLYSLTYGQISSMTISPIEKKPMHNFFPGSMWLTLGGLGCNFHCHGCQAWDVSHCDVKQKLPETNYMSPEMVVRKAKRNGVKGIAFAYNEPTMWFEFVVDVFKLAKEEGLCTCLVTNGYMNPRALEMISKNLDGICIDVKGSFIESYTRIADISDINIIFSNASDAKRRYAIHVEIVTNIIPGYNSNEKEAKEIAAWMFAELGKDTPWHLTRFFPYGDFKEVAPTPVGLLENLHKVGKQEGLFYVYIGNIAGHNGMHTYCQNCKKIVIKRKEYDEIEMPLKDGYCPYCKSLIFGRFSY